MSALQLQPNDNNYLTSRLIYQQVTNNSPEVTLVNEGTDTYTADNPKVLLKGDGFGQLAGYITVIDASTSADYPICNLPDNLVPARDTYLPVTVLRSGAYVANAIKISGGTTYVSSVSVLTAGSYATLPTGQVLGPGTGATFTLTMKAVSGTVAAAGTGYVPADGITLGGGTSSQAAVLNVASTKLVSLAANARGTGYAAGDTITLAGGTATTAGVVTVATTRLVSVAVNAGGTGYSVSDTITLAGGTSSVAAVLTVASVSGGAITGVTISTPGSYTVNSSTFTQASTSGGGTGATFNTGAFGVNTFTISTAGVYTANSSTFTQSATSGVGTGATFNTAVYGVNAVTVTTPGAYTVLPSSPVSQASTTGAGSGATFTMLWGLLSVAVGGSGGVGYTNDSEFILSGGGGTGGGTGRLNLALSDAGLVSLVNQPNQYDIVELNTAPFLLEPYDL